MNKSEEIKELKSEIRMLNRENLRLDEVIRCKNAKILRLKDWIEEKFDWWIDLLADGKQPCLKSLIRNTHAVLKNERGV